jgi:hypothetical protein
VEEKLKLNLDLILEPYQDLADVFAEGETVTKLPPHCHNPTVTRAEGAVISSEWVMLRP